MDKFTISFRYLRRPGSKSRRGIPYATVCMVHEHTGTDETHVLTGVSTCKPPDMFERWEGRKRSLTQAIRRLPRPVRKQIWAHYWEMSS